MKKLTQRQLLPVLKMAIDDVMDSPTRLPPSKSKAEAHLLGLVATQSVATTYILHNIGKKRRDWFVKFLQG